MKLLEDFYGESSDLDEDPLVDHIDAHGRRATLRMSELRMLGVRSLLREAAPALGPSVPTQIDQGPIPGAHDGTDNLDGLFIGVPDFNGLVVTALSNEQGGRQKVALPTSDEAFDLYTKRRRG